MRNEKKKEIATRRLSPWRVLIALAFFAGIIYVSYFRLKQWRQHEIEPVALAYDPWFASYVDVTSTPSYAFEQLGSTSTSSVILSFIVSSREDSCVPSWGTYYTMDEAASSIDLDRRIARLRQQGGKAAISFGGALNSELALECKDSEKLYESYKSVVDRYNINTIDLDLENRSLSDQDAVQRRADTIAKLQKDYRDNQKNLAVWLTLPVTPQGLTQEATDTISKMLSSGVDLAGINLMAMDYGNALQNQSMLDGTKQALNETHRQLGILYQQVDINLTSASLWRKIGVTPMIGQNDIVNEVFSLDDAKSLNTFALTQGIGRMSMWSANRDTPCGENYVDVKIVSNSCSGVKSPQAAFLQTLSANFNGDIMEDARVVTIADPESNVPIVDDPKKSPYQIWQANGGYPKGIKVVWHGNVYEAKWWTKNDLPDNPVLQSWQTPWQLIGPVLPGEKPIEQPALPEGTYKEWSGKTVYNGGDRVLLGGAAFQAKWWNQGESPAASIANPDNSPWVQLTQAQIEEILKEQTAKNK